MSSFLDDEQVDIDRIWDSIIEVFDIPVKEWGKYPSDEVVDGNYSSDDLEHYTYAYNAANLCIKIG